MSPGITAKPNVVYILPNKIGGVTNIIANLTAYRETDGMIHHALFTDNLCVNYGNRFNGQLNVDAQRQFNYRLPLENLHHVIQRLYRSLPPGPGVLVCNDLIELAMLHNHDPSRMVVQVLHGDSEYYYNLAELHQQVIDLHVCYSKRMYDELCRRLPHRQERIVHLGHGVPLPPRVRPPRSEGALRLVFAGRLDHAHKGVFDLVEVDRGLRDLRLEYQWTIIGAGPDSAELKRRWGDQPHVRWLGMLPNRELVNALPEHDVFVLPTRVEGFPVALLEAMGAGLVPVVNDIPSGVPEIVVAGETGFLPAVGDVPAAVESIRCLAADREMLNAMSGRCRAVVEQRYDIRQRVKEYQELFSQYEQWRQPRSARVTMPYGSRLDKRWLPNVLVYHLRRLQARLMRKKVSAWT